jgi:succinoglycan biosynthesis protein ExoA
MPTASTEDFGPPWGVVVIVPCLNEEEHIQKTLGHFMAEPVDTVCKIVVSDGGSTDRTLQIVEACAKRDDRIVIVHNERRIQSSGVNRAVEQYGQVARFIVRVDAHADYPVGYCAKLLAAQRMTGAASVVVSMIAKGTTCFQKAAAVAQNSWIGNGGSAHRIPAQGQFVEHGHHALMEVSAFESVGGYDESFSHNEDAELDYRLMAAGFRLYLCADADIEYHPRKGPLSLFRQYKEFGRGRAMTLLKHRVRPRVRQLLPAMVGPAIATLLLWPLSPLLAIPALCWSTVCIGYGIALGASNKSTCACAAGTAALLMHLGFSVGFISQVFKLQSRDGSRSNRVPLSGGI